MGLGSFLVASLPGWVNQSQRQLPVFFSFLLFFLGSLVALLILGPGIPFGPGEQQAAGLPGGGAEFSPAPQHAGPVQQRHLSGPS